jgi:hypothetical protein
VLAHHVACVSDGRAMQNAAPAQGLQTVRATLDVVQAQDRAREAPHLRGDLVCMTASSGRTRETLRVRGRRHAHADRKRNQCGDGEAAQSAACAISA